MYNMPMLRHRFSYERWGCSNGILPGVDLQILFLVEYWSSDVLFPSSFVEFSSVNIVGSLLVILLVFQELDLTALAELNLCEVRQQTRPEVLK